MSKEQGLNNRVLSLTVSGSNWLVSVVDDPYESSAEPISQPIDLTAITSFGIQRSGVITNGAVLTFANSWFVCSGAGTVTLPTIGASSANDGKDIWLWHDSIGTMTFNRAGSELIHDGTTSVATNFTLGNGEGAHLKAYYSVGSGPYWLVVSKFKNNTASNGVNADITELQNLATISGATGLTINRPISHQAVFETVNNVRFYGDDTGLIFSSGATLKDGVSANTATFTGNLTVTGSTTAGTGGTAIAKITHGIATLSSGTATINDTSITANSRIVATPDVNETIRVTKSAGASFTLTSSNGSSTANVMWIRIEP